MTQRVQQDMIQDVLDFHAKFEQYVGAQPHWPPFDVVRMRLRLISEEYDEFNIALAGQDLATIADCIGDLMYVLIGFSNALGIDMRPIWAAIHRANMAKEGGGERNDGKVLKPEGWTPPDLWMLLSLQNPDWFVKNQPAPEVPTDG
jgi:predicted HAD superfamily Cof-like phosphohydrolase